MFEINSAAWIPPPTISNLGAGKNYRRGVFLARTANASYFEMKDLETNLLYAGKVIPKSEIRNENEQARLMHEVKIHRSLEHKNIVRFVDYFDDDRFHYIIQESWTKKSMKEHLKRRKTLTDPEIAYIVKQIAEAIACMHRANIIHRDIKLGNIFFNDEMVPKVGDFGLSIALSNDKDRRFSVLGTPNYVAPEVLTREGHSFGVDVWALGVIAYTLAVGRPPFERGTFKETYQSIKKGDFDSSLVISPFSRDFILNTVHVDQSKRLTIDQVLEHPFLNSPFYIPRRIPLSCLTTPPTGDQ